MHKCRYKQRYFSCFAVFVLLAQLMLAASHVHLPSAHGEHDHWPIASTRHDTGRLPAAPAHQDDGFCALCWAQAAASRLLLPPAVKLRIPVNIAGIEPAPVFHRLAERTAPNAFRPRAPPAAGCA